MSNSSSAILPGATLGVFGGGQLGRMFALAARAMGYKIHIFTDVADSPAGVIADREWVGSYDDTALVAEFAKAVDVATFEFENVSSIAAEAASEFTLVRPNGNALHIAQNRLREKTFLSENGFPVAPFSPIETEEQLLNAISSQGTPGVLKTAGFGYDGKGQQKIAKDTDPASAWAAFDGQTAVYESFIDFTKEISVIGARNANGDFAAFPIFENVHTDHILDVTFAPAAIRDSVAQEAITLAAEIMTSLDAIGLLTVELFLTADDRLIVNELAPRPHNSGHLTMDGCITSQFQQHVRAVCNLPLGNPDLHRPAAMSNLLGDWWFDDSDNIKTPHWDRALRVTDTSLHLYGKAEPRRKRKMGHINSSGATHAEAIQRVQQARKSLK